MWRPTAHPEISAAHQRIPRQRMDAAAEWYSRGFHRTGIPSPLRRPCKHSASYQADRWKRFRQCHPSEMEIACVSQEGRAAGQRCQYLLLALGADIQQKDNDLIFVQTYLEVRFSDNCAIMKRMCRGFLVTFFNGNANAIPDYHPVWKQRRESRKDWICDE
jgi:hypothetical protein